MKTKDLEKALGTRVDLGTPIIEMAKKLEPNPYWINLAVRMEKDADKAIKKRSSLTICESCNCMTKTLKGKCGKCKRDKVGDIVGDRVGDRDSYDDAIEVDDFLKGFAKAHKDFPTGWRERFDKEFPLDSEYWVLESHREFVIEFIELLLDEQEKNTLDILDKAELEQWFDMPNTTKNWKMWKRIRNMIRERNV